MANANVKEFTDANFKAEVEGSQQPVLVDFWAEWCMPCRMLTPTIDKLADSFAGKAKVGKVNTDNSREVAVKYGINAIPTVILFNKGQVVQKFVGVQAEAAYANAINAVMDR
jgi:thioredoxin 1